MPQTIYPYTSPKTHKVYNVPWNGDVPPTDEDFASLEKQIATQEGAADAPAAPAAAKPGSMLDSVVDSVKRFYEGAKSTFHPLDMLKGAALQTAETLANPGQMSARSIQEEANRQAALPTGKDQLSALHRVPVVGDVAGNAADAVRQGNTAGGLGQVTGAMGAGELLARVPGVSPKAVSRGIGTGLNGVAWGAEKVLPAASLMGVYEGLTKGEPGLVAGSVAAGVVPPAVRGLASMFSKMGAEAVPEAVVPPTAAALKAAAKAQDAADVIRRQAQAREGTSTSGTPAGPQGAAPSKLDALVREVQQPAAVSASGAPDASLNRIGAFSAPPAAGQGPTMVAAATPAAKLAEMVQAAPDSPAIRATKSRADQVMPGMTSNDLQVLADALKANASHEDAAAAVNAARAERSKMYATNAGLDKGAKIAEMTDTAPPQKSLAQSQRDAAIVPIAEALQRSLQAQAEAAALRAKVTPVASHPAPAPPPSFGTPAMLDMLKKKGSR